MRRLPLLLTLVVVGNLATATYAENTDSADKALSRTLYKYRLGMTKKEYIKLLKEDNYFKNHRYRHHHLPGESSKESTQEGITFSESSWINEFIMRVNVTFYEDRAITIKVSYNYNVFSYEDIVAKFKEKYGPLVRAVEKGSQKEYMARDKSCVASISSFLTWSLKDEATWEEARRRWREQEEKKKKEGMKQAF